MRAAYLASAGAVDSVLGVAGGGAARLAPRGPPESSVPPPPLLPSPLDSAGWPSAPPCPAAGLRRRRRVEGVPGLPPRARADDDIDSQNFSGGPRGAPRGGRAGRCAFFFWGAGRRRQDVRHAQRGLPPPARGTDVVVGFVETHGRARTAEQVGDLEVVPRRAVEHRGATFEEMDVDAILRPAPEVVLVDELAHTNVPGSRHAKRWQDIEELLDAGIDVISTVNIQHLESLNDVVERITGVRQRETVPDEVVRAADQIELVDMTPEALRRRLAHGNVYAAEQVDAALANYFRPATWRVARAGAAVVADRVDESLQEYRGTPRDHASRGRPASGSSSRSPGRRMPTT